jgi:hypothetical protein
VIGVRYARSVCKQLWPNNPTMRKRSRNRPKTALEKSRMGRTSQRGYAALVVLTVLVLGVVWYTVGSAPTVTSGAKGRADSSTAIALKNAKQALLAYVAANAANQSELYPGRLPCPEKLSRGGTTAEGQAAELTDATCDAVGRLPWKTLGVDQIRDGYGEPVWYAVAASTWAYSTVGNPLTINPGLGNQLNYDGAASSVVAVIISPGRPITTTGAGTPPGGCAAVNQQVATRNSALAVANFLECGNATGNYVSTGPTSFDTTRNVLVEWSNDRSVSITAGEVMVAIAGAIADRMQRQVAPALANWDAIELAANGKSWNNTWGISFLPFASNFDVAPATNNFCGNGATREGMLPVASKTSGGCSTDWPVPTVTSLLGLASPSCTSNATNVTCSFNRIFATLGQVTLTSTASHIGSSFRGTISASDVVVSAGGTKSVSMAVTGTDQATITVTTSWPLISNLITWLLTGLAPATITIPHVADAAVLSNANLTWYTNNGWHKYTYYQVAPGSTVGASPTCPTTTSTCLTVNGLPSGNGNTGDKRMVLTYWGATATGSQDPAGAPTNPVSYLEAHTASSLTYSMQTVTSAYNDRIATCPYKQTWADATTTVVCN